MIKRLLFGIGLAFCLIALPAAFAKGDSSDRAEVGSHQDQPDSPEPTKPKSKAFCGGDC